MATLKVKVNGKSVKRVDENEANSTARNEQDTPANSRLARLEALKQQQAKQEKKQKKMQY